MTKQNCPVSKENFRMDFAAIILQEAIYFAFPCSAKSLTKFNTKKQGFKHVLDLFVS